MRHLLLHQLDQRHHCQRQSKKSHPFRAENTANEWRLPVEGLRLQVSVVVWRRKGRQHQEGMRIRKRTIQ